jgi:hypothetical protein
MTAIMIPPYIYASVESEIYPMLRIATYYE